MLDNQPTCRQCGFWLEHADLVTEGIDQTAIGIIILVGIVLGSAGAYLWGEGAIFLVGILVIIATVPFGSPPGKRWYCFRCKRFYARAK